MDLNKDKNMDNKYSQNELDFEAMNATLANPEFANWYYNQMYSNNSSASTIEEFVKIIQEYSELKTK